MLKAVHWYVLHIMQKGMCKKKDMNKTVIFQDLGKIRYKAAWDYQEEIFADLLKAKMDNNDNKKQYLLFCEHEPVYTLGKSGNEQNLLITEESCKSRNIDYFPINRGGDITYHGPGQLVVYPIIDLEEFHLGIKSYISLLEDVVIDVLADFGIKGEKGNKAMGVWIDVGNPIKARKICAIGVKASRYVTMHGLALNINTDLTYFTHINPCGFTDKEATSMEKELEATVDFNAVSEKIKNAFAEKFEMKL